MLDSDPKKELLEFFMEENEKSREQELELFFTSTVLNANADAK